MCIGLLPCLATECLSYVAQDAAYEPLHDEYAKDAVDIILKLKGFYIKVRPLVATVTRRIPALLPRANLSNRG